MVVIKKNISKLFLFVLINLIVYKVYAVCQYKEYAQSFKKDIPNPNRGFYTTQITRLSKFKPLTKSHLQKLVDRGNTVLYRAYCLDTLRKAEHVSSDFIDKLQDDFDLVESVGMQLIIRIYYSYTKEDPDARLSVVKQHIKDLKSVLTKNAKNIFAIQIGYIGTYGEGYYTNEDFGDKGKISTKQWRNRYEVIKSVLLNTSPDTVILVRTPEIKINFLNSGILDTGDIVDEKNRNRLGYFNDCFLSSDDDVGTYENNDEYNYVKKDTKNVPIVGETCRNYKSRTNCESAVKEMERMHFSSLNSEYNESVLNLWKEDGCYKEISERLGYQLRLSHLIATTESTANSMITFHAEGYNNGFSAPFDYKYAKIILKSDNMQCYKRIPIKATTWKAGGYFSICAYLQLPKNIRIGKYEYILEIADSASHKNYKRNILFVNSATQNLNDRLNHLHQYITVTNGKKNDSYCSKNKITHSYCPLFEDNDAEAYPSDFKQELKSNVMKCTSLS
ncbi:hypothetical protein PIROE2DRAFT_11246 [Piromyces sp. E2]|nr:hypothetical protein PIROE2DRAFT_11246 [Piromyces sp. E2]|eukprot:OUM62449.1 hypothetical protein PIROE2DRAFT_11246 [Piromyces sp. E2]